MLYFAPRTLGQVQKTLQNLETTYFIRLTAEFEGILKDHLRTNHPDVAFPSRQAEWKLDWFLSRVLQRELIRLDVALRQKLDQVAESPVFAPRRLEIGDIVIRVIREICRAVCAVDGWVGDARQIAAGIRNTPRP